MLIFPFLETGDALKESAHWLVLFWFGLLWARCLRNRFVAKPGTDFDLLQQLQTYEAQLKQEDDGESTSFTNHLR